MKLRRLLGDHDQIYLSLDRYPGFVQSLTQILESVPAGTHLHVPLANLSYIDHSVLELLEDWGRACRACGSRLSIEQRGLKRRVEGRLRRAAQV